MTESEALDERFTAFAADVLEMLAKQRAYFRSRDPRTLEESKRLEADVKKQAEAIRTSRETTRPLF